jgi:hypothetical protein
MNTDGHGYKMFFAETPLHPEGEANCDLKIRVYPWFYSFVPISNCGI